MSELRERVFKAQLDDETWRLWRVSHINLGATAVAVTAALVRHWLSLTADERTRLLDTFGDAQ